MAGSWMIQRFGSQPQVFISYQRPEIGRYFYNQLESELRLNNIIFCSDWEIDRESREDIFKSRIEKSKIVIVIFSEKCTESTWWLRQLIMIANCVEKGQLVAIPIFYKLEPITINRLRGNTPFGFPRTDLEIWEKALMLISNKNDFMVAKYGITEDGELIVVKEIVEEVKRVLKKNSSEKIKQRCKNLRPKLLAIIGCLVVFLYFSLQIFTITPLRNLRDKDNNSFTSKDGAEPARFSSSDAKTHVDVLDRTITNSPVEGKVKPPQIQVFINFRGEQVRNKFVGYLVHELMKAEVNVYIDSHELRGEDLNTLFKRIEDSGIAIVVFSTKYSESKWCLDELVKIKERVDQGLLKVLPIFYNVRRTHVKQLKGEFGDHFRDKEHRYGYDSPLVKGWKEAIVSVCKKFSLTFDEERREKEIDFVQSIVKVVLKMLQSVSIVEKGQSSR